MRGVKPEKRYESLVKSILSGASSARQPAARRANIIVEGKGFGSTGQLKVDGKIFAMLVRGTLVLKLPSDRVDDLVESGHGERFDAGKGRPMREWLALSPSSRKPWLALAREAMAFVNGDR
ncbi:MAG: hypothetical protein ACYDA0_01080 [Candidatus Dormibacteraceae bacterium]